MASIDLRFSPLVTMGNSTRISPDTRDWGNTALVVTESTLEDTALEVQDQLETQGVQTILFSRSGLVPTCALVDELLTLIRRSYAAFLVCIGDSGTMSLGRLLALCAPTSLNASSVFEQGHIGTQGLPLLEIPGTGRHSLLFRSQAYLHDEMGNRVMLVSYNTMDRHSVHVDSSLFGTLAPGRAAHSSASRLTGAVESLLSPGSMFLSSLHSRHSASRCYDLCSRVIEETGDPDYSAQVAESMVMNALCTGLTGVGPVELLAWAVSCCAHTPAAATHAVLLPWFLESPFYSGSPRLAELLNLFDADHDHLVDMIRNLYGKIGIPGRLRDLGAKPGSLLPAAEWASTMMGAGRVNVDESLFRDILELAC